MGENPLQGANWDETFPSVIGGIPSSEEAVRVCARCAASERRADRHGMVSPEEPLRSAKESVSSFPENAGSGASRELLPRSSRRWPPWADSPVRESKWEGVPGQGSRWRMRGWRYRTGRFFIPRGRPIFLMLIVQHYISGLIL